MVTRNKPDRLVDEDLAVGPKVAFRELDDYSFTLWAKSSVARSLYFMKVSMFTSRLSSLTVM